MPPLLPTVQNHSRQHGGQLATTFAGHGLKWTGIHHDLRPWRRGARVERTGHIEPGFHSTAQQDRQTRAAAVAGQHLPA